MNEHPVWHVYDELRTAKLNVCYYRSRLAKVKRWHTARELLMAASGSVGVAGLWFFMTPTGEVLWKTLASVAAFVAVYHSVTRPSETIRKLETQVTGWAQLEHQLAGLRRRIHEAGRYDEPFQKEVKGVLDGKLSLLNTDLIESDIDTSLRNSCFERVNGELPPDLFFVPDSPGRQP